MPAERLFTRPFVAASLANLFQELAWSLFLHFPGFLHALGADEVQIGILVGLTAVASITIRPLIGTGMDRQGRRVVIIAGNVLHVVVLGLYLTISTLGPWVYVVRILHGLASAMLFTSLFTYAADWVPAARRTQGLAIFGISGLLPIGLGGLVGDVILDGGDFRDLFLAALTMAALALALSLPLRDAPTVGAARREASRGFRAALLQRDLLPMWALALVFSLALAAFFTFLKTFVLETGLGSVGLFFAVYTGTAIALRAFAGDVPDRVGQKRVLYPAFAALAAGFLVLAAANSAAHVAAAGLLSGIGHGYGFPIMFGMVVTRAREAERGSAMSIFTALFDVGALAGGPAFGLAIRLGGYPVMWVLAAALVLGGSLLFALWDRRRAPTPVAIEQPSP